MSKEKAKAIAMASEYAYHYKELFIGSGCKCKASYKAAVEWQNVAKKLAQDAVKEGK